MPAQPPGREIDRIEATGAELPGVEATDVEGPDQDSPGVEIDGLALGGSGAVTVADGTIAGAGPARPGQPTMRWASHATSIDGIERELARIWSAPEVVRATAGGETRHVAARTSVMNLVVIARQPELGEHCAAIISQLTGRHPSRTLICSPVDPDGPGRLSAQVTAHCILPREDAAETCAEFIYVRAGGETGRHLDAIVEPLIIHDLPVTLWWPGEPPLGTRQASDLLESVDRLVVDGSGWTGDGLERLGALARLVDGDQIVVFDFALVRQSRWREAIASTFDLPEFLPYVHSICQIGIDYGTHDELGRPGRTNLVKPLYHAAWIASRLGMNVARPLQAVDGGHVALLHSGHAEVSVVMRPVLSPMPGGTTLRVELVAERRGSRLLVDVGAEAETVHVDVTRDEVRIVERRFLAPRRSEVDLLAEAIEAPGRDPVSDGAIRMAARIATGEDGPGG